jgi:hypothetical protein
LTFAIAMLILEYLHNLMENEKIDQALMAFNIRGDFE